MLAVDGTTRMVKSPTAIVSKAGASPASFASRAACPESTVGRPPSAVVVAVVLDVQPTDETTARATTLRIRISAACQRASAVAMRGSCANERATDGGKCGQRGRRRRAPGRILPRKGPSTHDSSEAQPHDVRDSFMRAVSKRWIGGLVATLVAAGVAFAVAKPRAPHTSADARLYVSSEESGTVSVIDLSTENGPGDHPRREATSGVQVEPGRQACVCRAERVAEHGAGARAARGGRRGQERRRDRRHRRRREQARQDAPWRLRPGAVRRQRRLDRSSTSRTKTRRELTVVDTATGEVVRTIAVGTEPEGVALSPTAKRSS